MKSTRKENGLRSGRGSKRGRVVAATSGEKALGLTRWLGPGLVVLLTLAAFLPALQNGFVDWDDEATLVHNPNYRGLGWAELRWMFTTFHMGHYQPLSWVTFALDYLLWGMEPFGYHLTNLLLHAINAVLFYFLAVRLLTLAHGRAVPGEFAVRVAAAFSSLIFAVHPLRVESVAWATQRRDLLSSLFLLAAVLCYLRAATAMQGDSVRRRWLAATLVAYGMSLLSKASGITLPIVLLVIDVYPLRRLGGSRENWFGPAGRRVWMEKVPFFLLAVVFGIVALMAQKEAGALKALERYGLISRLGQGAYGVAFYLWKSVIPTGLSPLYELPFHLKAWDWPFVLSGLVVFAISAALYAVMQRWPTGLAIWICYLALLAPVLGVAQSGPQMAADRYSYLSCLGWAALAGAGLLYCWRLWAGNRLWSLRLNLAVAAAGLVVGGLALLSWRQAQVWRDSETLWRYAVGASPESGTAHYNLALILQQRGELEEAIGHYRRSLESNPNAPDTHNNLGKILAQRGELEGAIQSYRQALQVNPAYAAAYVNLGTALAQRGELEEAIKHYRRALQINPADADVYFNLGTVLVQRGKLEEAIQQYRQGLKLDPNDSEAHFELGRALVRRGGLDEAMVHFRQALLLRPDFAEAHEGLGRALAQQGKRAEAIQHIQEALRILKSGAGAASPR